MESNNDDRDAIRFECDAKLKTDLKVACAKRNITLGEFVIPLIEAALKAEAEKEQ